MREMSLSVARGKSSHAIGFRVRLVLEENFEVACSNVSERYSRLSVMLHGLKDTGAHYNRRSNCAKSARHDGVLHKPFDFGGVVNWF